MYLAVSNHFRNDSYNYFKYGGKIRVSKTTYMARRDQPYFEKAARIFKKRDYLKCLVGGMIATGQAKKWIGAFLDKKRTLNEWRKRTESLSYRFKEEITEMREIEPDFNNLFNMKDGKHPQLFRFYNKEIVSLETLVILDSMVGFTTFWKKRDELILGDLVRLITKYSPFMFMFTSPDMDGMKGMIRETWNLNTGETR